VIELPSAIISLEHVLPTDFTYLVRAIAAGLKINDADDGDWCRVG
jgi:hypothetical protein